MAEEKSAKHADDQELNDLLDSALKDFNEEQKLDKGDTCKKDEYKSTVDKNSTADTSDDAWTTDFIKETTEQFVGDLQNFIENGTDDKWGDSFKKMAQTVANAIKDDEILDKDGANTDFQSVIARALDDLSATTENLQNEADLSDMFVQVSLEDGPDAILPFMQGMLQHLLSKEILYPSLKDLVDKYFEWIEEKKATIPSHDLQRFTKQLELMRQMCSQLENEEDGDTDDTKKKRFETIMSLMQEVQACGQLPEELMGEQTTLFQTNGDGGPVIPTLPHSMDSPQNCCLM